MAIPNKIDFRNWMGDYYHYAAGLRGTLINSVAEMEQSIDDYIATHFCYNLKRRTELREIIISTKHLSYNSKVDIVKFLLLKRKDVTTKEANRIETVLTREIGKYRNMLAHAVLDYSLETINKFKQDEKTVYFIRYENGKKPYPFGRTDIIKYLDLAFSVRVFFDSIKSDKTQKKMKMLQRRNSKEYQVPNNISKSTHRT